MKKYKTAESCIDAIIKDRAWRRNEISFFKRTIEQSPPGLQEHLSRAGVLVVYSHWEGFFKKSCLSYIRHINEKIKSGNVMLTPHFDRILLWKAIQKRGDFPHLKSPIGVLDALILLQRGEIESHIPESFADTKSNLNYEVLSSILRILDIPLDGLESKKHLIDERLLGLRNQIAHGNRIKVDAESFSSIEKEIRDLTDTIMNRLLDCVERQYYAFPLTTPDTASPVAPST